MYINLHTHHQSFNSDTRSIVNLSLNQLRNKEVPSTYFSVGLHPWDMAKYKSNDLAIMLDYGTNKNCIAIGECGLDKSKGSSLNEQITLFIKQVHISETLQLPLIIHCVRAYSEIIKFKKDLKPKQPWIFHAYNGSKETTMQALRHGFYFSLGEALNHPNSKAKASIHHIPHDHLFFETDDKPKLGIKSIYQTAAHLLDIEIQALQLITENNFKLLFNENY